MRLSMSRIIASTIKALCTRVRFSKSFASLRQRPSQPNVPDLVRQPGKQIAVQAADQIRDVWHRDWPVPS